MHTSTSTNPDVQNYNETLHLVRADSLCTRPLVEVACRLSQEHRVCAVALHIAREQDQSLRESAKETKDNSR